MRELIVLRHAKSDWDDLSEGDHGRGLNSRGLRDAPRMGRWLRRAGYTLPYCLSSDARRARLTAALAMAELADDAIGFDLDARIYEATVPQLLDVLASIDASHERVLLIGHNPGLEELVDYLSDARGLHLATATAAVLAMPDDWRSLQRGDAKLTCTQRPRDLD